MKTIYDLEDLIKEAKNTLKELFNEYKEEVNEEKKENIIIKYNMLSISIDNAFNDIKNNM